TVALIVQCFDHISGAQLNPTVTLARALGGHESAGRALALAAAQLAGALLGAAAAAALGAAPAACLTRPADGVAPYQAAVVEAALGGCLALANLAAWDERTRRLRDSWPLRIGLSVAALTFAAGEVSGASMNPVRSFAPALLAARWEHQWVYWVGPLSGSCVCTALYRCVWRVPPARDSPCVQCARCAQCVQCARCVQCVRCAQCAHSAPPARTAEPDCTRLSDKAPAPIRLTTD
ncbi:probable aquaporin TIP4-3, partial [Zerene cesonia]|uniref:probable aquaporin TIP4-3 n=1 Tax=Zerene cesonia TaxID=33412 RepID=UPI0018E561D3